MEEDSKAAACMNDKCRVSLGSGVDDCIQGWPLGGGGSTRFAALCHFCGSAYQQLVFCDIFHSNDSGWRDCTSCTKRLHCGCIASSSMIQLLDSGGVSCISCSQTHPLSSNSTLENNKDSGVSAPNNQSTPVTNQSNTCISDNMKIVQCGDDTNNVQQPRLLPSKAADEALESLPQAIVEEKLLPPAEFASPSLSFCNQSLYETTQTAKPYEYKEKMLAEDLHDSSFYTNLTISLSATSGNTHLQPAGGDQERSLGKNISSFPQGSTKSRYLLPKPLKSNVSAGLDTNSGTIPQLRVARPPVEGRIKNQLLPRYWPRITHQELQQISGDSNSTVVPLFEKVLSASDAGRIGRLVLPKSCAEAYFPPISQPEGLPLRIQDIKGKEWLFQFRFWPNNNSRMYVLEGVTPCIQSMQLKAGDTVTFSRMDPEGKLVMGFRKSSNTVFTPDNKYMTPTPKCTFSIEPFVLPVTDSLHSVNSHPDSLQLLKESRNIPLSALSKSFSDGDFGWHKSEMNGGKPLDGPLSSSLLVPEHQKNRNIGSKNKRLLIDSQDALELKLSWEELQNMLCPPPGVDSSTVTIEDHEFEEYDQPPVFRKSSIFTVRPSGEQEQWTQCDSCLKWRSLPADVVLPFKWTCEENTRAQSRPSCSAKDELSPQELENLLKMNMEFKRQKIAAVHKPAHIHESSDPGDLGNPALVGGDMSGVTTASAATTTKHPRHRPGCSCIVCIQPPSGKGKHKPACTCNVCMTVKRRFKTLMMRRKKRQSEREAEVAQRGNNITWVPKEEAEVESFLPPLDSHRRKVVEFEFGSQSSAKQSEKPEEIGKGQLDLNCHPGLKKLQLSSSRVSMVTLLQEASLPLETYLKQKGLTSLVSDQLAGSGLLVLPQAVGENEELCAGDHNLSHRIQVQEEVKQGLPETHQAGNDPS